jgi:biopolymer transport protein ExbD
MILWNIRHQGSPVAVEGVSAEDILEGVKEGLWDTTDEVLGPNDADWVSLEQHPIFAQAMADYEPPPPKPPDDETRLDMNPLIDVALVLLIFFILTTTYEQLRKELNPPPADRENKQGKSIANTELKKFTIRLDAYVDTEGKTVFRIEDEPVAEANLEAKLTEWTNKTGNSKLAIDVAPKVPWRAVIAIQDAAAGAKIAEIIRVVRPPRE